MNWITGIIPKAILIGNPGVAERVLFTCSGKKIPLNISLAARKITVGIFI